MNKKFLAVSATSLRLVAMTGVVASATLLFGATLSNATIYTEDFEAPFPTWESNWLGTNSNLTNYYGIGQDRGNNPDGLWVGEQNIVFNSAFGASLTGLSLDVASWAFSSLNFFDSAGNLLASYTVEPNFGAYSDPGVYAHFSVTSSSGISGFLFTDSSILGNLSIDNVVATTESAPVPEPATMLLVGSGIAGLAVTRRRK